MHTHQMPRLAGDFFQWRAIEQTRSRHELDAFHLFRGHLGLFFGGRFDRMLTTRGLVGEIADRAGYIAQQHDPLLLAVGVRARSGGQQRTGVRVHRVFV